MSTFFSSFPQARGLRAVMVVVVGQLISILATGMTQFATTVWAYEKTGSVSALALVQVFFITPFLIMSPIAGAMIDRYNRKLMMAMSDFGAVIGTAGLLVLSALGVLEIWHLYVAAAINGLFSTFQWPAYSASISLMVPKDQLERANGMVSLMESGPAVVSPLLAGALYPLLGLTGLLWIDVVTFGFAFVALLFVFVPQPEKSVDGAQAKGSLLKEAAFGFKYIFARPSLLGLQMVFFFGNLFAGLLFTIVAPMVLARTGNNATELGVVQTAGAVGAIIGGLLLTWRGGLKRRVHGVLLGHAFSGVMWVLIGFARSTPLWVLLFFVDALVIPLINASNQSIWQAKVAPDLQGRVFSARRLIAWFTNPITPIMAGLLADRALEPGMRDPSSDLARTFGDWVGVGPGTGMSLLMIFGGLGIILVGLLPYLFNAVRNAEDLLPDHTQTASSA
jgi:MFS transporter, DHA3 family, macrolide efflux protein